MRTVPCHWRGGDAGRPTGRFRVRVWGQNTEGLGQESGLPLVGFHCDESVRCCTFAGGRKIIAGDAGGRLHFLLFEE